MSTFTFQWNPVDGVSKYDVAIANSNTGPFNFLTVNGTTWKTEIPTSQLQQTYFAVRSIADCDANTKSQLKVIPLQTICPNLPKVQNIAVSLL